MVKGKLDVTIITDEHDEYLKRYDVSIAEAWGTSHRSVRFKEGEAVQSSMRYSVMMKIRET